MDRTWHDKLEQFYRVFSRYRLCEKIEGCPCCVRNEDEAPFHQKALRDLDEEDLGTYAAKAQTSLALAPTRRR